MPANRYIVLGTTENLASWESRIYVDESAAIVVDDEPQLDAALLERDLVGNGREIYLRGEGTGGIIDCVVPKKVTADRTKIRGPGVLRFSMPTLPYPNNPRAITIEANDCVFEDFRLTSTAPLDKAAWQYGFVFSEQTPVKSHRTVIRHMTIDNWFRCLSKDGGVSTQFTQDVRIQDSILRDYLQSGAYLNYGFDRLVIERCRGVGATPGDTTVVGAGLKGGSNWRDCMIRDCVSTDSNGMGYEFTRANAVEGSPEVHQRTSVIGCVAQNTKSFGFSLGFVRGGLFANCIAKDVAMCGFEMGGRAPEYVQFDPSTPVAGAYAQGIIDGCVVDGVHGVIDPQGIETGCMGMSIDGAEDTTVIGCEILNCVSTVLAKDMGLSLYTSERCAIRGVSMRNFGVYGIRVMKGYGPSTRGFHVIEGNTFRNKAGDSEREGVYVENTGASVRQNTCWAVPGTVMHHLAAVQNPTAKVYVDGTLFPTDGYMLGSNVVLPG